MAQLNWDSGTAYDLFISLFVLHRPDRFGLRPQWAAGVRSRLPQPQREFLEEAMEFLPVPLSWVSSLPTEQKTAMGVIAQLEAIPAELRLKALIQRAELNEAVLSTIERIQSRGIASTEDLDILKTLFQQRLVPVKLKALQSLSEAIINAPQFGENILSALQSYHQVFFAEEEERIKPFIVDGLAQAQALAKELPLVELIEELSHGIKYELANIQQRVWLAPSYWSTPLVFINQPRQKETLMVFGCRPDEQNLVPGEYVPDALVGTLKAMSDATRLRILHYLKVAPATPSSLARLLRLRAPTVVHHLSILRLAGLVHILISEEGERRYALRKESLQAAMQQLMVFLESSEAETIAMDGNFSDE
ncbi:MAG: hypothetical protein CVU39_23335 [Chloroflexi bacterium HGW-Chloroflexi-10]|nr:MAG: hypothetical protein CVU39_23335 [Chloroflexi bacterium HGW-Chloroflexi-10]